MKISLVIPVYNEEKYISKLLDSVLTQTRLPDEVVICDNGSTDQSVKIIKSYSSKVPLKLVHEPRKGIIPAMETAWRSATGDLILRTDADCILPVNWIKNVSGHFLANPELDVVGGFFLASDGNRLVRIAAFPASCLFGLLFRLVRGFSLIYGGNQAIKKKVLLEINGYKSPVKNHPDDQLISQKIAQYRYKTRYFFDCWNYTSLRRFNNFRSYPNAVLCIFKPSHYHEKTI